MEDKMPKWLLMEHTVKYLKQLYNTMLFVNKEMTFYEFLKERKKQINEQRNEEEDNMQEYLDEIKKEWENIENEYKEMGKELPKPKFKVNDLITITDNWFIDLFGETGIVTWDIQLRRTLDNDSGITYLYHLHIDGRNGTIGVQEESITLKE